MKANFLFLILVLSTSISQAVIQEGQIFYVPVDSATYQTGNGKSATIEIQVAFLSKADAENANQNLPGFKSAIAAAIKSSKIDMTTKIGKMVLGAEVANKLQDSGYKAQTVFWNSFTY